MRICTSVATECVGCGNKRRKLQAIPSKIIDYFFKHEKIIVKCCQKICKSCLSYQTELSLLKVTIFKNKRHTLSTKWLNRLRQGAINNDKVIHRQHIQIEEKKRLILIFQNEQPRNTKYTRIKFNQTTSDYEEERKKIPRESESNRWKNKVQYELLSESDCLYLTGFTRTAIINQAKMCAWPSYLIFNARFWMKHYPPKKLQALMLGRSVWQFDNWKDETLKRMQQRYAKPVLINGKRQSKQFWTRERIKQNTPNFVYLLREVDKQGNVIILNMDGTYQYCQTVQSSHDIKKKTTNMHKHRSLIKIHIFSCTNGMPIYASYHYGDGYHSDGKTFEALLDESYIAKCERAIKKKKIDKNEISFRTKETCKELRNLQKIIKIQDHCICDNGYRINDPRPRPPAEAPADNDNDGQTTVLAASYKRGCTAIRQTEERIHTMVKRNKFARTKINRNDIKRVPWVWDIGLADLIREKKILMKDDENSTALTARILDMRHCATNPADFFWKPKTKATSQKKSKKKSKRSQNEQDDDDADDVDVDDEEQTESEEDDEIEEMENEDDWETVAIGWTKMIKYIKTSALKDLFVELNVKRHDVKNYPGKDFERYLTRGYLKRMNFNEKQFKLQRHRKCPQVFMFVNMKSKWKSSKKYSIILNFREIHLFNLSYKKWKDPSSTITIQKDEQHWYKWLKCGRMQPVSTFLSKKYKARQQELDKRRVERMNHRRRYYYGLINVGKMKKAELIYFAREHEVIIDEKMEKKQLRDYILEALKQRKTKEKEKLILSYVNFKIKRKKV